MIDDSVKARLEDWAEKYNDPQYFKEDPISFPRHFLDSGASLRDIEISAVFAAHFAWGRRAMIVRDCQRFFDFMQWRPYDYVMCGDWRSDEASIHRTVKWSETARICAALKSYYLENESLESLDQNGFRTRVYLQKQDLKAPDKKINMLRRWMVRRDGRVDLGVWKSTDPKDLVVPLDVHVYDEAVQLGLTARKSRDLATAMEITGVFREIWPSDPLKGDFALFGYGVSK